MPCSYYIYLIAFVPTRKPIKYSINGNGLKWHKSFTLASNMVLMRLAERDRCTNFLSSLLNIYFHPSVFQSLPLLIYFRNDPNRCLHCTKVWHKTYLIGDSRLSRLAWHSLPRRRVNAWRTPENVCVGGWAWHSFTTLTEITPKLPFLWVNRSLILYDFHGVNIA